MPRKTNLTEIIEDAISGKIKITNNAICGKCSKCGECCTPFLPITQKELDTIQEYVIKNKIRPQTQILVMQNRLSCPYHNGKKCLIYEVRPLICKEFYCYKNPDIKTAQKFANDEYVPVDMWAIAKEIYKYFK